MRARVSLGLLSLVLLACADQPSEPARAQAGAGEPQDGPGAVAVSEPPSPVAAAIGELEAAGEPRGASAGPSEADRPEPVTSEPGEPPTEPTEPPTEPTEPGDPLAPILPAGPEPGSPAADAELAELLEESTLTQEEFDAAFGKRKPNIEGDQFVFGAGERTRARPVVEFGTPKISSSSGSTLAASEIAALAAGDRRRFEACLALALAEDPSLSGAATLSVRFDADGEVASASATSEASGVTAPLRGCLAAVADDWRLPAAAGASVSLRVSLRSE